MEDLVIEVESREATGRIANKALRAEGRVPVNLYGPSGNKNLSALKSDVRNLIKSIGGQTALFEISEGGTRTRTLIQEIQKDSISGEFIHLDLREIAKGVEITTNVVVHTKGAAFGVKNEGGIIEIVAHELEVKCLPRNLPSEITVDVTELHINDSIHIGELPEIEGVTLTGDPQQVVVTCAPSSKSVAATEVEEEEVAEAEEESTE